MLRILVLSFLILTAAAGPVAAEVGPQGWGPRVGISSGPDQILFGAHFDFGNFAPNVGFRPHVHLGLGDNLTTLSAAADAFYRFTLTESSWRPYLGGTFGLLYVNVDRAFGDASDTDLQLMLLGGVEGRFGGNRMMFELKLELVDAPDLIALVGWTF